METRFGHRIVSNPFFIFPSLISWMLWHTNSAAAWDQLILFLCTIYKIIFLGLLTYSKESSEYKSISNSLLIRPTFRRTPMTTTSCPYLSAPRRSRRVDHVKIVHDGDLWVEKKRRLRNGRERSFFRSVKTKRCRSEPPTGASLVVYLCEIHKYPSELQAFAFDPYNGRISRGGQESKHQRRYRGSPLICFEDANPVQNSPWRQRQGTSNSRLNSYKYFYRTTHCIVSLSYAPLSTWHIIFNSNVWAYSECNERLLLCLPLVARF